MAEFVRHYLLALQFLTRVPVTGRLATWVGFSPQRLRASAAHLPGVGWLVGAAAAGVLLGACAALPPVAAAPWVAAVLSTIATVMLTGAFHEDGLADLADGLGGSADRQRAMEIMKDSRIGSYGTLALVLALLAKIGLVTLLAQQSVLLAAWALFAAHVTARLAPLVLMATLSPASAPAQSKSRDIADGTTGWALLAAGALWTAGALALAGWQAPPAPWWQAMAAAALGCAWMARLLRRRLGGFTGDGLGATQQVCEILFYLGLALA